MFHKHKWVEMGRKFNEPTMGVTKISMTSENIMQIIYGMTVVEMRCESCGMVTGVRYTGDSGR